MSLCSSSAISSETTRLRQPALCRFFRFTFQPNPGVEHFQVAEIQIEGVPTSAGGESPGSGELPAANSTWRTATARVELRAGRCAIRADAPCQRAGPGICFAPDRFAPGALSFEVSLDRPERFTTTCRGPNELLMTGTLNDGRGGKGVTYATRLRVLATGRKRDCPQTNRLLVGGADEVILLVSAATDFRGFAGRQLTDPLLVSKSDLDKATAPRLEDCQPGTCSRLSPLV